MRNNLSEKYKVIENPRQRAKDLEQEVAQLKKALKRAEIERDILKNAAAHFASQELKSAHLLANNHNIIQLDYCAMY